MTLPREDYYEENGCLVFTETYHLKRGYCCESGCRHCPWKDDISPPTKTSRSPFRAISDNKKAPK